ncbi:general transcription factor IIH subunit 2-like isoform X1 [Strongylocentrotus purpuratus]|uniref:General transcription factor IIH subunit n=1 Tax=Strongylocentrotus purpuratus TaxID=7668 RepID=A0A7M7REF6_STRPU|nr:general transcription factor IIH subunit 2-like isoform X1 [Strongylocentrotus purpuratus]|eukprot:XP_794347.2 PREDICTED: general transcription factor IIH subunit 2-like [Strongylocentrotus purpuratus]
MADDEPEKGYTWEGDYERTWEALQEDEEGSLQATVDDIIQRAKRRRLEDRPSNVRLGMMRHLFILLDCSRSMEDQDLKPNRLACCTKLLEHFIEEYFDQNPISQVGIITSSNMRAEKLTELGGNPQRHITALEKCNDKPCVKEPSLQNALELAAATLRHMPGHASREILVIMGSLTTCDPGNIHDTIQAMKDHSIRCCVIGLAADVRVCRKLATVTHGTYGVILDETHFKELLMEHTIPPPARVNTEPSPIRMGFPQHVIHTDKSKVSAPSMCMCHLDGKNSEGFGTGGYFCPQCQSKYCELPVECRVCGLTLVSAPHLARSFHHLFPLDRFEEFKREDHDHPDSLFCQGCQSHIRDQTAYRCPKCSNVFCLDCELFIQESLHSCPGCASTRPSQSQHRQTNGSHILHS